MDSESLKEYCRQYMNDYMLSYSDDVRTGQLNLAKQVTAITESMLIEQGIATQLLKAEQAKQNLSQGM